MPPGNEIIAITGHRVYGDPGALYRGLDTLNAKEYYIGGAKGIDTDALEYLSKTQPLADQTVVVPNRVINQPASSQVIIRQHATRVIELKNTGLDRYQIRNEYMVNHSDRTVAFYDFRGKGGTYNTINYSHIKNKDVTIFPLREFDVAEFESMYFSSFKDWVKNMKHLKINLSSIKMIIIKTIENNFSMTVNEFTESMGYSHVNTLEELWLR